MNRNLLPEEDAIEDPDEDDEADPTLPGDLWFRQGFTAATSQWIGERGLEGIVYFVAFAPK